MLVSWDISWI